MPVTSVFWPNTSAQDVDLLPGYVGPQLDQLLRIRHTVGELRADNLPAPATVSFAANFTPGPGTAGVTVSTTTGEVTVTAVPAPPRLLDFIVTATVTEGAAAPFTAHKRFRIHTGITRTWLTPATLTARQNARNVRFTLLAEFDDGTYGDLSTWCPWDPPVGADRTYVHRNGDNLPAIHWRTSAAATVNVHEDTGRLTSAVTAGNATITAELRPLPAPPGRSASGTARADQPWSHPVTLTPVTGPEQGIAAMARAVNILILPDGFQRTERAAFEWLARDLAHRLRKRRLARPYDLLRNRMNYFIAWVPSREGGVSPLPLVKRFNVVGARADASELETAVADVDVPAEWRIAAPPLPATKDQFLLNERDTAFHVVLGERPRVTQFFKLRVARFNALRFDEQDFDDFLNALQNKAGAAVGAVWARGGNDQKTILVLSRSGRTGGANNPRDGSGRYICMTLDSFPEHLIEDNLGGLGKDLRPDPIPATAGPEVWTTVAHELAHSFELLDEYGGDGSLPVSRIPELTRSWNTDARANLLTGGSLDANKIKWRWPRLRRAGLLAHPANDLGGNRFSVPLRADHARSFVAGDVVRFRVRSLLGAPAPSDRFIVKSKAGDTLEVEALTATPFDPATYPVGSVLICPVRDLDPNVAGRVFGDDLELVHATVLARINASRNPLNARYDEGPNRACTGAELGTPTAATNFPPILFPRPNPPVNSYQIVGLYENGGTFDCNAYRPTGACMMRQRLYRDVKNGTDRISQFCPVCQYAIVDQLDPTQHRFIDADYALRYPT
ncbi:hypothetical protein [Streptomyces canus]|uniref:hypothetical protein n=1 Tax=Streptomyces canus TaxID=58343 RepID=UPI002E32111A|nr:hypothetical protein [Streptomyces canus]